ncbi:MAG: saccharopine dehydrogenase NADP-binding domain-containing protein [Solirubrobacterales bacterium]|nr:saccharopine dehydrogenase NADP-binding domain-containing protein [Solirubrobacterales bacterium]
MQARLGEQVAVAVLGAGGTIAPGIVRDLAESAEVREMLLLDLDGERAAAVAAEHGGEKATSAPVDAREVDALARRLADVDVLVNTAAYRVNLDAMRSCLAAGCHYFDLGGLYRMTRRQLELGHTFEREGLLALLGIGSSPGKTNLMAAQAVERLGGDGSDIRSIDIVAGGRDPVAVQDGQLRPPYALQTLLDELTLSPIVVRDGRAIEIEPLSAGGVVDFGEPIGRADTIYTLHSELATFGASFACRSASFRLSLASALLARLRDLAGTPADTVEAAARDAVPPSPETVSVHLVKAVAESGEWVKVRAVTRPFFGLGGSIVSTAAPAAACVRLLARGSLSAVGAFPPERCLKPSEVFSELEARGCTFEVLTGAGGR